MQTSLFFLRAFRHDKPQWISFGRLPTVLRLAALFGGFLVASQILQAASPLILFRTGQSFSSRMMDARVLMIGDSLSVGGFGEAMQNFLISYDHPGKVTIFAVCGSSPEHWLQSEPVFSSKCGYREYSAKNQQVLDFHDRVAPPRMSAPKIEDLVKTYNPSIVIVQLGTNWMDELSSQTSVPDEARYEGILERMAMCLRGRRVIWILPPDSAHFSRNVQNTVERIIRSAAQKFRFTVIESRSKTKYVIGRTGTDGVHYNEKESQDWADLVIAELTRRKCLL